MAKCPTTNNPSGLKCPTDYRRFANIGKKDNGFFKHVVTGSITLAHSGHTTKLFSRNRTAGMDWRESYTGTDSISCQGASGANTQYQHTESYTDITYDATFKEEQTIVNNEVIFLDLRHDILVRKETTYTFDKQKKSSESVLWNQYGATLTLHKVVPKDIEMQVKESIILNTQVVDTRDFLMKAQIDYAFAVPISGGTPQNNTAEDYYIWSEHKDEDGGYDLYYPEWVRGISKTTVTMDDGNRDRHRRVVLDRMVDASYQITSPDMLTYSQTHLQGAWAVSPQTKTEGGADNYRAYETMKLDGKTFKRELMPADSETDTKFGNPTESVWPISPL